MQLARTIRTGALRLIAVSLLSGPTVAHAALVDFQSLASTGGSFAYFTMHEEDGYRVSGGYFASAHTDNALWYAGSTGAFNNGGGANTTFAAADGSAFDLYSIDLARAALAYPDGASVTFVGNRSGGGTVTQTFTVGAALSFQTFYFSGFSSLTSVVWTQDYPYHQFDDICVGNASCSVDAPEPATLALLGLGLAGVGFSTARRRRAN